MVRNSGELGVNIQKIYKRLISNQNLLKLLYYNDKDPLSHDDLTEEQITEEVFEKLVKIVPRIGPKETANSIIAIKVSSGTPLPGNKEFEAIGFSIEIFVPMTQWIIKNTNLRPFAIMGEIENSLKDKNVNGLGTIKYGGFVLNFLTEEISSYEQSFYIDEYN